MNKFTKALLLSLLFAAPVAISAPAVQAKTVGNQLQQLAPATTKKVLTQKAYRASIYIAKFRSRGPNTFRRRG